MFLLLVANSIFTEDTITGLATAARDRGHEVAVFFDGASVRLVGSESANREIEALAPRGVRLLACRTSAATSGISSTGDLIRGAEMSSLSELVELMEESDRTIFLG